MTTQELVEEYEAFLENLNKDQYVNKDLLYMATIMACVMNLRDHEGNPSLVQTMFLQIMADGTQKFDEKILTPFLDDEEKEQDK